MLTDASQYVAEIVKITKAKMPDKQFMKKTNTSIVSWCLIKFIIFTGNFLTGSIRIFIL